MPFARELPAKRTSTRVLVGESRQLTGKTQHIICARRAHVRRWNLEFSNRGENQIFFALKNRKSLSPILRLLHQSSDCMVLKLTSAANHSAS